MYILNDIGTAWNVGQLKELLKELPDNLCLVEGSSGPMLVSVGRYRKEPGCDELLILSEAEDLYCDRTSVTGEVICGYIKNNTPETNDL